MKFHIKFKRYAFMRQNLYEISYKIRTIRPHGKNLYDISYKFKRCVTLGHYSFNPNPKGRIPKYTATARLQRPS